MRRSVSESPSRMSMALASYSLTSQYCGGMLESTCSRTVASSRICGFCCSMLTCRFGLRAIVPLSGGSWPAITRRNVDFPVPLMPMTPVLSPSLR